MSEGASYYGRPIVKPHVWTPLIAAYFWIGGTAGVAAVHSAIERTRGNDELANAQKAVACVGMLIAPVLLIADLGVPKRFPLMLRVFKPTSPMNMGSWILTAFGGSILSSSLAQRLGWTRTSRALEYVAALTGPLLATYTAVLISDTATPVWHEARTELPFVFVASATAGAGACGALFAPHASSVSARRLVKIGGFAMFAATNWMEARLGSLLAEPYRTGAAGGMKRASRTFALTGAALMLVRGKHRVPAAVAAVCVAAAGILERYAVLAAGKQSALDPKYTVEPQRARLAARAGAR